jgi:hypothetical protein
LHTEEDGDDCPTRNASIWLSALVLYVLIIHNSTRFNHRQAMSLWRLLRMREPEQILKNREFLRQRRREQFKLLDNSSVVVDRNVLDMKVRELIGKPNLVYAFGREAIKHEWLNGLADVNF